MKTTITLWQTWRESAPEKYLDLHLAKQFAIYSQCSVHFLRSRSFHVVAMDPKRKTHAHSTAPDNKDILLSSDHGTPALPAVIYFQYSTDDKHEAGSWSCHANRKMIWHSSRGDTDELRMRLKMNILSPRPVCYANPCLIILKQFN